MYNKILLPTDGSKGAEVAVDYALDLAGTYDATLHVLYVLDLLRIQDESVGESLVEAARETGEKAVDSIREKAVEEGVSVVTRVLEGFSPHTAILEYIEETDQELVVMGTHGRSGLQRFLLGSTTEKVVRKSPVPVICVPINKSDTKRE